MIALLVGVVGPISGFIPNTPIVATLLPVLENWCHRRGISPSRVLLPLSYATILGGTISLLGTSTNLLASEISRQLGYGSIELFSFTAIGIPVWLIGVSLHGLGQRRACCPTGAWTRTICWPV
jgi:di/tricarboxylate transporter